MRKAQRQVIAILVFLALLWVSVDFVWTQQNSHTKDQPPKITVSGGTTLKGKTVELKEKSGLLKGAGVVASKIQKKHKPDKEILHPSAPRNKISLLQSPAEKPAGYFLGLTRKIAEKKVET